MENERRYAIKSVRKLEREYQKYSAQELVHTRINVVLAIGCGAFLALFAKYNVNMAEVIDINVLKMIDAGILPVTFANCFMSLLRNSQVKSTAENLNKAYDELKIPEEERIIDDEGRSK